MEFNLEKDAQFQEKFRQTFKTWARKKKKTNDNQISRGEVMAPIQGSRGARSSIPPPPGPFVIRLNEAGTVDPFPEGGTRRAPFERLLSNEILFRGM